MGPAEASSTGTEGAEGRGGAARTAAAGIAERELSLLELLQILNRRKGLILTVLLIGIGLTLGVMALLPRVYVARALVMIDPEASAVGADPTGAAWGPVDNATIDSQVELLGSRTVARAVVLDLRLEGDPELNGHAIGLFARLESLLPFLRDLSPEPAPQESGDGSVALVDRLLGRLAVERVGKSRVIAVTYASGDPDHAARLANAVVEHYVLGLLEAKHETTRRAAGWLGQRLAEVRERLAKAQSALDGFKAQQADTLSAGPGGADAQLGQLGRDLMAATVDRTAKEQKLAHLKQLAASGDDQALSASVDDIGASVLLRNLNALKAETLRREAELSAQLGDLHPKIIDIHREKAELDQRIDGEERALIAQYASMVELARARERTLAEELDRQKARAVSLARAQEEVSRLQGEVELNRRVYEAYQDRLKATADVEGTQQPDARVISEAVPPPAPAFPRPRMVTSVALTVSIAVALLAVYLAELADRGFRSTGEVEAVLRLPGLGLVPRLRRRRGGSATPQDYVVERPQSRYAEALRGALATLLAGRPAGGAGQVVLLTSALPGEGKTSLTLSLGRIAAAEGLRVLVVDADLRHPCVHEIFGPRAQAGLAELLRGEVELEDVLKADPRSTMDILPGSHRLTQPTRLLGATGVGRFFSVVRGRYDLVLVDSAPLLAVADARLLALHVDRVLFVVRWQATARTVASLCLAQLDGVRDKLAGVLLNLVDLRRHARYGHTERAFASARLKAYYAD